MSSKNEEATIAEEKALVSYDGEDRVLHWTEYIQTRQEEFGKYRTYNSGFKMFDQKIQGLLLGEVTVISGHTKQGKSLFAESLLKNLMKTSGIKVCVFSFEMPPEYLLQKYADWEEAPLYLPLRLEAMNPEWLRQKTIEAKLKYGCEFFLYDHLHFLVDMATKQNMSLNIGGFMRTLKKKIAMDLNVHCVLIAHQSSPDEKNNKHGEPRVNDIRDSTFIAQEADNVILVHRRKDFTAQELVDIKIRNFAIGDEIERRTDFTKDPFNPYANQFATVTISRTRRAGTFDWPKLFQKVGNFMEEV